MRKYNLTACGNPQEVFQTIRAKSIMDAISKFEAEGYLTTNFDKICRPNVFEATKKPNWINRIINRIFK